MRAIIVHGGAGRWSIVKSKSDIENVLRGIKIAVEKGWEILENGDDGVKACEEAIKVLEDYEIFNAGYGSALNIEGEVEMDASIMVGTNPPKIGIVGAIKGVKNPISIAKRIMEQGRSIMIVGNGAKLKAKEWNFEEVNLITEKSKRILERWKERYLNKGRYEPDTGDTVGCAVFDGNDIVVGVSTGGIVGKEVGRLGDSALPGAGFFANHSFGIVCTGIGEEIIKNFISFRAVNLYSMGFNLNEVGRILTKEVMKEWLGLIMVNNKGEVGWAYNTNAMPFGYMKEDMKEPFIGGFEKFKFKNE